ncbi:unnamed protein product [Chrysoparadoxa australica]
MRMTAAKEEPGREKQAGSGHGATLPSAMAGMKKKAKCVQALNRFLDELRHKEDQELLRRPLREYGLFPPGKDPNSVTITIDDLKRLVRQWKLHEVRGFWKANQEKDALADVLLKYMNDNSLFQTPPEAVVVKGADEEIREVRPKQPAVPKPTAKRDEAVSKTRAVLRPYNGDLFNTLWPKSEGIALMSRFGQPETDAEAISVNEQAARKSIVEERNEREDTGANASGVHFVAEQEERARAQSQLQAHMSDDESEANTQYTGDHLAVPEFESLMSREESEAVRNAKELAIKVSTQLYAFSVTSGSETEILKEGGLEVLRAICKEESTQVVSYCSAAICNMCVAPAVRKHMLANGGISGIVVPLVYQPYSTSDSRQFCARTLYYLSLHPETEAVVFREGLPSLTALCACEDDYHDLTRRLCLVAMGNILVASDLVFQEKLKVIEAIVPVLSVLCLSSGPEKEDNNLALAYTTMQLSLLEAHRKEIVDLSIVTIIAAQLKQKPQPLCQSRILLAGALVNLTKSADCVEGVLEAHVLEVLAPLARDSENEVRLAAAAIIANLTSQERFVPQLEAAGILSLLTELGESFTSKKDRGDVVRALSNMTYDKNAIPKIVSRHAHSMVIDATNEGATSSVMAGFAIKNLLEDHATHEAMIEAGVLQALPLLAKDKQQCSRLSCAQAVLHLSHNEDTWPALLEAKVSTFLVRLTRDSMSTRKTAVAAMASLSRSPELCEQLIAQGAITTLKAISSPDAVMWHACAVMLSNFALESNVHTEMLQQGVLKLLAGLCEDHTRCRVPCVKALAEFAHHSPDAAVDEIVGVLSGFIDDAADPDLRRWCCSVLLNLSAHPTHRRKLSTRAEFLQFMVGVMRISCSETEQLVARALCNLTLEKACAQTLVSHDLLEDFIVVALLRSNTDGINVTCCKVFVNLLSHGELRPELVRKGEGLAWALVKAARNGTGTIRDICGSTLYNLSCEEQYMEDLLQLGVNSTLLSLARDGTVTTRRNCASVLLALVLEKARAANLAKRYGLVEVLKAILTPADPDCEEMLSLALTKMAMGGPAPAEQLLRDGVMALILNYFSEEGSSHVKAHLLEAVSHLSKTKEGQRMLLEDGAAEWLLKFVGAFHVSCKLGRGAKAKCEISPALYTLSNLACSSSQAMKQMAKEGLLKATMQSSEWAMEDDMGAGLALSSLNVQAVSSRILFCASYSRDLHTTMADEGAIECLAKLMQSKEDTPSVEAMLALRNLSTSESCARVMCQKRLLDGLAKLLARPNDGSRSQQATADSRVTLAGIYQNLSCWQCNTIPIAESLATMQALEGLAMEGLAKHGKFRLAAHRCVAAALYNLMANPASEKIAAKGAVKVSKQAKETSDISHSRRSECQARRTGQEVLPSEKFEFSELQPNYSNPL